VVNHSQKKATAGTFSEASLRISVFMSKQKGFEDNVILFTHHNTFSKLCEKQQGITACKFS
jgi:hypothetical protein